MKRRLFLPELSNGQVLVKVTCCTICGSDVHTYTGRRNSGCSCVLGHEIIGTIEDWFGEVPPRDFFGEFIERGQRVTWAMAVGCGDCFFCLNGLSQKCESLFKYGHHSASPDIPSGGLSELCVLVKNTPIFPLEESLSDDVACPANCATATVVAALRLVSESHRIAGANVLVLGAGLLGLTATAAAIEKQAQNVVAADIDPARVELARKFGAIHSFEPGNRLAVRSAIDSFTQGRGFDVVLDFAGVLDSVEMGIESARIGGCVILVGSVFPTDPISLSPESIVRRMLTIRGLHNYGARDLADGLALLTNVQHKFPFGDLVGESFSLDNVAKAFKAASESSFIRVAVRPSVGSGD